jgi:hypothetical protein
MNWRSFGRERSLQNRHWLEGAEEYRETFLSGQPVPVRDSKKAAPEYESKTSPLSKPDSWITASDTREKM